MLSYIVNNHRRLKATMTRKAVDHLRRIASALLMVSALVAGSADLRGASGDELPIRTTTLPTASVPVAVGVTPSAVAVTSTAVTSTTETPLAMAMATRTYDPPSPTMSALVGIATTQMQQSPIGFQSRSGIVRAASATFESTFKSISAGDSHTCAVSSVGEGWCWGNNSSGQIGDGTSTNKFAPVLIAIPAGEPSLTGWETFSAGYQHTCGVTTRHTAYCWGDNTYGQLGDTTKTARLIPALVQHVITWATVVAGGRHTCGLDIAGTAYCWGDNSSYALGDTFATSRALPNPVATPGLIPLGFTSISVGKSHTCAKSTGSATFCWGSNGSGQLGDGTMGPTSTLHTVATSYVLGPLATGSEHSCGIASTGSPGFMYCWGSNSSGQIGNSTTITQTAPAQVSGSNNWKSVVSSDRTTCGTDSTDTGYCWGSGGSGQIGDGVTQNRSAPTAILTSLKWAQLSAGGSHTCGIAQSGKAYCWGSNAAGQIGHGSSVAMQPLPVIIPADPVITTIARGVDNPRLGNTSASATFVVSFSRSVSGVATSSFNIVTGSGITGTPVVSAVSPGSTPSVSHTVTVSLAGANAPGGSTATIRIALASVSGIADTGGNQLASTSLEVVSEAYLVETVAPTITSITRTASSALTRGLTAPSFRVVFSEVVSGVGTSSFIARLGSSVVATPTFATVVADPATTVAGLSYAYTVTLGLLGAIGIGESTSFINIDISSTKTIYQETKDEFGNPLTVTTPTGSVSGYILDTIAPRVTSITRAVGTPSLIGAQSTPTFTVVFSEAVTGVATSSFTVVTGSSVTGTPTVKSVTPGSSSATTTFVVALDLAGTTASGAGTSTIGLDIPTGAMISDSAGNSVTTGITPTPSDTFTLDTVAPGLTTTTPTDGILGGRINGSSPLTFQVVFTKSVFNVSASAFTVERGASISGTPSIAVSGSGLVYNLSVGLHGLSAPGDEGSTLQVRLASPSPIADAAGNLLASGTPFIGAAKTLDTVRPEIASVSRPALIPERTSGTLPVDFIVSMTEPVKNVSWSAFMVKTGLGIIGVPTIKTFAPVPGSDTAFAIGVSLTDVIGSGDPTATIGIVVASGAPGTDLAGNLVGPHSGNFPLASSSYVLSNLPPSIPGGGGSDPAPPRVIRVPLPVAPVPERPALVDSTGSTTATPKQSRSPGGLPDAEPVVVSARQQIAFSDALKSAGSAATITLLRLMDDLSPHQRSAVTAIVGSVEPAQSRALVSTLSSLSPGELATLSNLASTLAPTEMGKVFGALADLAQSGATVSVAVPDAMKRDVDGRETLTFSLDEPDASSVFVDGAEVGGVYSSNVGRRSVFVLVRPGQQARIARPKSGNWPSVALPLTYGDLAGVVPLVDPPADASVLVFEPAPPGLSQVEQGSLGGGIVVPVAAPFRLTITTSAPDARAAISMPSLVVPSGQTPAYLQSTRNSGGEFFGYLRSPAEFNPSTGRQDWSLTASELDRTLFLPVGLQAAFLVNLSGSAHLYSGPDDNATDFGLAAPANTIFPVIGPQVGLRISVFNPVTKGYGWIDAQAVAPSGPPDNEDGNRSGDAPPAPATSQARADTPPLPVTVRTRDPRTRVWSSAHPDATDFGPIGVAPVTYQVLKREANRYYVVNPISGNYAWIDIDAVDEPGATPSSPTSAAPAPQAVTPKVAAVPEFVRTRDAGTHVWSTPYADATDFGPIGRAPVTYQVLEREADRYFVRNPETGNYSWIDVGAVTPMDGDAP